MNAKLSTIIKGLIKARLKNKAHFLNVKRQLSNQQKIAPPLNSDLLKTYYQLLRKKAIKPNKNLVVFLLKREIRTLSGVAVITVLTKPYRCPGQCIYCPSEPGMPKSYLSNEPAAARAKGTKFDPYKQVKVRLDSLKTNGHKTNKVELIVLGGSWSVYPKTYQTWFIKRCFDGLNGKTAKTLGQAQKLNERASHRCVGLTLETRPDLITEKEIRAMRQLGCTRVELGVQSIYDPILKLNKRGHTVKQIIAATHLLKQAGFKVMYHLMPNLPGSTPAKDLKMFKEIFANPDFQPDMLKIYPCIVTKNSVLYRWYQQDKFKPYSDKQLKELLVKIKKQIPYYVRITRLVRDIPAESIVAGNKITNLRQIMADEFKGCKCIRCREAGHSLGMRNQELGIKKRNGIIIRNSYFIIRQYRASNGIEYFLSYESKNRKVLYAFLRLRINDFLSYGRPAMARRPNHKGSATLLYDYLPELHGAAIIRELHTFGEMAALGQAGKVQHLGLGKKLMAQAEAIAKKNKLSKIAVISGIGVRQYYQKLGYKIDGTYVIKNL